MKNKFFGVGLLMLLASSCTTPGYLPSAEQIDINAHGSYIKVIHNTSSKIDGELIAIDSNNIFVLADDTKKCVTLPIGEVKWFSLRYAKPKHYGWTIPLYTLATIGHGRFLIFSAPVNLIVTISVTASGENAFKYSHKDMTYDQLRMFARFPQGIPPNVNLASIK